ARVSNERAWTSKRALDQKQEKPPFYYPDYRITGWREQIIAQAEYHANTNDAFDRLWKPYPVTKMLVAFDAIVNSKVETYKANEPKRERRHARQQAIVALQLSKEASN